MSTTPDSTASEAEGHGFKLHLTEDTEDTTGHGIRSGRLLDDDAEGHAYKLHLTDEQADDDAEGHGFRHLVDEPGDDTQGHVTSGHKF
jgi:hypothetical protein